MSLTQLPRLDVTRDPDEEGGAPNCSPSPVSRSGSLLPLLRTVLSFVSRSERLETSKTNSEIQSSPFEWLPFYKVYVRAKARRLVGDPPVIVQRLADCPPGYPRLAAFQCSDENFLMYRRFGYLQSRVLLDKQDELRILEEKLQTLDKDMHNAKAKSTLTRDVLNPGHRAQREELIRDIEATYCTYANFMTAASQMIGFNRPSTADYKSMRSYTMDEALVLAENGWIQHKEDLITLRPGREHAWLDSGIEHLLRKLHCSLLEWIFCSKDTAKKIEGRKDAKEVYYTKSRVERLVNGILLFVILALLVVPVYLLYYLVTRMGTGRADAPCMGVLLVATLGFSAVLAVFTRAKRHEILAAAAAYCAVLVVFLGNVPQLNRAKA